MTRPDAERFITDRLRALYGFALRRCRSLQDAQDLSQEIALRALQALTAHDEVTDPERLFWTVAHNALANYYRDHARAALGVPLDALGDLPAEADDAEDRLDREAQTQRLRREIAYLSETQRAIVVAYYFERRKQSEIARALGLPTGTVKWHLFEARRELQKGMETMRETTELQFHPIRFALVGTNGSVGERGENGQFFRTALSQNIAYATWREAKTARELADALGVSPVYVESEADFLAEYGFLLKIGGRYRSNILLGEPTAELVRLHDAMYDRAASLLAPAFFDALSADGVWNDPDIRGGATGPLTLTADPPRDRNFILWSLIPYVAARCGDTDASAENAVSFAEAATIRPDGARNICQVSVLAPDVPTPRYFDQMQKAWCGPFWTKRGALTLWQIDHCLSGRRIGPQNAQEAAHDLMLLENWRAGALSPESASELALRGYLRLCGDPAGQSKATPACVWLHGARVHERLLAVGARVRDAHRGTLEALKAPYVRAVMADTPAHLRTMQAYCLQFLFRSDGWFLLWLLQKLTESGCLTPPEEAARRAMTRVILEE